MWNYNSNKTIEQNGLTIFAAIVYQLSLTVEKFHTQKKSVKISTRGAGKAKRR